MTEDIAGKIFLVNETAFLRLLGDLSRINLAPASFHVFLSEVIPLTFLMTPLLIGQLSKIYHAISEPKTIGFPLNLAHLKALFVCIPNMYWDYLHHTWLSRG